MLVRGLQMFVHHDAALCGQTGCARQCGVGPKTHGGEHEVSVEIVAILGAQGIASWCFCDLGDAVAQMESHPCGGELFAQALCGLGGQQAAQGLWGEIEYIDFATAFDEVIGEFAADETGTQQRYFFHARQTRFKLGVVVQVVY